MRNLVHENYYHKREDSLCLNGEWEFAYTDKNVSEAPVYSHCCSLPGSVYDCIYKAGILPNPYQSTNAQLYTWADKKTWYFKRKFFLPKENKKDVAILCLDGCGYYSKVFVNGRLVGKHEGLFGGPYVNIFYYLRFGEENEIVVEINAPNPENKATRRSGFYQSREIMPWNVNSHNWATRGGEYVMFGIWRDIRIEFCYHDRLGRPFLYTEKVTENSATLQFECDIVDKQTNEFKKNCHHVVGAQCMTFDQAFPGELYGSGLEIELIVAEKDNRKVAYRNRDSIEKFVRYTCPHDNNKISEYLYTLCFEIQNPRLWWVNGMGEQPLYQAEVKLYKGEKTLDCIRFDFGIRTIEQDYTTAVKRANPREKYSFSINGKSFFVKGMNLMQDNMLYTQDEEKLARQVFLMKQAGIQLVRVWNGGNQFESEAFYRLCNENGILVWQDLLLANCANTQKWNMGVVRSQIALNIQRIRNHSSLAVYCGGNEFNEHIKRTAHVQQESRITVEQYDWTRKYYVTTSYAGSAHVYNTIEPTWFYKSWKDLNFMSECGWASFPNYKNFRKCFQDKDRLDKETLTMEVGTDKNAFADFPELQYRITEFEGNLSKLLTGANYMTDIPRATIEEIFECANLPVMQRFGFLCEAMRSQYPATGGLMPWVFNRMIMTMTGCQCVDADGEPLPAYYAIQKGYQNSIFALELDRLIYLPNEKVRLNGFIINDINQEANVTAEVRVYDIRGVERYRQHKNIFVNSYKTEIEFDSFVIPQELENEYFFVVVKMQNGQEVYENVYFLRTDEILKDKAFKEKYQKEHLPIQEICPKESKVRLKDGLIKLKRNISYRVEKIEKTSGKVEVILGVKADGFVFPFSFKTDENAILYADDNYFALLPNEERSVRIILFTDNENVNLILGGWNTDAKEIRL